MGARRWSTASSTSTATRPGCTACTSPSTPRAPGPTTPPAASASCCSTAPRSTRSSAGSTRRADRRPARLYFIDGRAKVEIALAKGKKSWDKRHALAERTGQPREGAGRRSPPQGHGLTVRPGGRTRDPRALAGPRAPGALRRPRALPAREHPAAGLRAVRQRRAEDRPRVADPLPRQPRRAGRAAAVVRAYAASRRCPTRTARAWRRTSTTGPRASPPTSPSRCGRRRSTRSPRRRRTSRRAARRPASRCSRSTCRWARFHLDDPLLDEVWGSSRTPARRSSCTPGRAGRQRVHRPRPAAPGARAVPAAGRWSSRTWVRRSTPSSSRWPSATSGCASTPRWSSRTSSTWRAPYPRALLPRLPTCSPKVLLGSDFPTIPYPYAHQLDRARPAGARGTMAAGGVLGQRSGLAASFGLSPCHVRGTEVAGRRHPSD